MYLPQEIKELIKKKNKLGNKWKRTGDPEVKWLYNRLIKKIKKEMKYLKNEKWKKMIQQLNIQDKSLWKRINEIRGNNSKDIPELKGENNQVATSDKEKAEILVKQFAKVYETSQRDIKDERYSDRSKSYLKRNFRINRNHQEFEIKEAEDIIASMAVTKAPGNDDINVKILKIPPKQALEAYIDIMNKAWSIGYFPDCWKIALVKAIPKKGKDNNEPKSYRPVSLLPILSKIYDKMILQRLSSYSQDNGLVRNEQFGFRQKHSCQLQLLRFVENIIQYWIKNGM